MSVGHFAAADAPYESACPSCTWSLRLLCGGAPHSCRGCCELGIHPLCEHPFEDGDFGVIAMRVGVWAIWVHPIPYGLDVLGVSGVWTSSQIRYGRNDHDIDDVRVESTQGQADAGGMDVGDEVDEDAEIDAGADAISFLALR